MKTLALLLVILSVILAGVTAQSATVAVEMLDPVMPIRVDTLEPVNTTITNSSFVETKKPVLVSVPAPAFMVIPEFETVLWDYSNKCSFRGFLGSCEPQKYIMPDNAVVEYAASLLYVNKNGYLRWNQPNPFNAYGIFTNDYIADKRQFSNLSGEDYWINPDYYIMHGFKGDCEDSAFAVASILESKGIQTRIVGGYLTYNNNRGRDWIVEYKINGTYYRYFGGAFNLDFISRELFERYKDTAGADFEPVLMFGRNTYYQTYNWKW